MKVMQKLKDVVATLPAEDIDRAKSWYADKLGVKPVSERADGLTYEIGGGRMLVYPSSYAGTNTATSATLVVDDVRSAVDDLRGAGVRFETYDMPGANWEGDVATVTTDGDEFRGAWCKDSEGNIIAFTDHPIS